MINKSILIGRLTKDVTLRKTQSNKSVVQFTLACNRNKSNDGQPEADFINCVAWNGTADAIAKYLHKGSLIGIEGRLQSRSYDDKNGNKVYITEVLVENVQFLESKNNASSNQQSSYQYQPEQSYQQPANNGYDPYAGNDTVDIASDDLPF